MTTWGLVIRIFVVVLLIKHWKQPKCLLIESKSKMCGVDSVEYYSAVQRTIHHIYNVAEPQKQTHSGKHYVKHRKVCTV